MTLNRVLPTLRAPYCAERIALYASSREYLCVQRTLGDDLWLEYLGERWGRQRYLLYGDRKHAFANEHDALENQVTDESFRLMVAHRAGRVAVRKGWNAVPSTRS